MGWIETQPPSVRRQTYTDDGGIHIVRFANTETFYHGYIGPFAVTLMVYTDSPEDAVALIETVKSHGVRGSR